MKKYNKKEIIIISLFILLVVFGFLFITGTINSGYHLVDDHEIVRITKDIENDGFIKTLFKWTEDSFSIRFRPLYFIIRVLLSYTLGVNIELWYVWKALEICGIIFFLYFFARNLKCNKFISILFPIFILIGYQSAILYRLGPQEATGLLFIAIALYFISENCLYKKKTFYTILIYLNIFLMSLMKESFVLLIPAIVLLKIILDYYHSEKTLKQILKNNAPFIITFFILFVLELCIIVFFVGTNQIGYAGFSSDTPILAYYTGIKQNLHSDGIKQALGLSLLSVILLLVQFKNFSKKNVKISLLLITSLVYIIFSQLFLHAKSTMFERYIVPMSFAYSFFIIIISPKMLKDRISKVIYFFVVFGIIIHLSFVSFYSAQNFASNGININNYLNHITENYSKDSTILTVMEEELQFSTIHYLNYYNYENTYLYKDNSSYVDVKENTFDNLAELQTSIDVLVVQEGYEGMIFNEELFNSEEFNCINFGRYNLFAKK